MKDCIDIFQALGPPIIAGLVAYVAFQQWRTNKNRLRLELFQKRYPIFEATKDFLYCVLREQAPSDDVFQEFNQATKGALFVFEDDDIDKYIREVFAQGRSLQILTMKMRSADRLTNEERLEWDQAIKWLRHEYEGNIEKRFAKYLRLRH